MRRLGLVAVFLLFVTRVEAATYYVSTSGNDGNSCATAQSTIQANQKLTISVGVACLSAGDTLLIHAGTYTGTSNIIDNSLSTVPAGTNFGAGAVTIGAYTGETVIIQPPDGYGAIKLASGSVSGATGYKYIIFQDLVLDGINQTGAGNQNHGVNLNAGANHIRILRVASRNWISDGYQVSSHNDVSPWSTYHEFISSTSHDNGRTTSSCLIHGLYIETSDNLFDGLVSWNNSGYGIQLYDNGVPAERHLNRNIVSGGIFHDNGLCGGTAYGIVIGYGADNLFYNNILYGNLSGGISVYANSARTGVYNNTIYGHSGGNAIDVQYIEDDVTIRNNIMYANTGSGCGSTGGTIGNCGGFIGGSIVQDHNLSTNPSFTDAAGRDFSLQAGSAAIDAGGTISSVTSDYIGTARPQNSLYDIGAYEYIVAGPPPSTVTRMRLRFK